MNEFNQKKLKNKEPIIRPLATEMNKAPVIDEPLAPTYTIKEGKKICLTCRYTAYPRCDVIWLRDNQPIDLNLMGLSKEFKVSFAISKHLFIYYICLFLTYSFCFFFRFLLIWKAPVLK